MKQEIGHYLINGDNCTALMDYNLEIINQDLLILKIYLAIAVLLLLFSLYKYFKAYAKMVGYSK